jgi:hypothetical protein
LIARFAIADVATAHFGLQFASMFLLPLPLDLFEFSGADLRLQFFGFQLKNGAKSLCISGVRLRLARLNSAELGRWNFGVIGKIKLSPALAKPFRPDPEKRFWFEYYHNSHFC